MFKKCKKDDITQIKDYTAESFFIKFFKFIYLYFKDLIFLLRNGGIFKEYGVTMYCGQQGAGKTIAMTEYLERMRKRYPNVMIITNYGYIHQTREFNDWKDFFEIRNGADGVIFAIDEIQNEFNNRSWKNFPEELMSEITQQRKQKVKIVCTAQEYLDVAVQLRRQSFFIVDCFTFAERWVFTRCYKRRDYEKALNSTDGFSKVRKIYSKSFIQDAKLRSLYDTEKKIERLERSTFMSKRERGVV
ncbi:zonular occludens toxin domain-containing protein [Lysinibacillus sp. FSL K6-0232]|uniref:zonular occludens toxin domain-containing protein n=1 Tax=Lysinibacillus sp. FSL K6-0232 TaxID=2921425 RepID=UPI0030F8F676